MIGAPSQFPDRRFVLSKWRVPHGATVAVGQVICEIESDESATEIEAFAKGTLIHLLPEWGECVPGSLPFEIIP
jgi:pyruvate/2-oxoglutarate dehydrogenase complex dihydrolipoamide acyltransferase (E2) component